MAISELQQILIGGLKGMDINSPTITAMILMLKTENQQLTMLDWIIKHQKDQDGKERALRIAQRISEQVK